MRAQLNHIGASSSCRQSCLVSSQLDISNIYSKHDGKHQVTTKTKFRQNLQNALLFSQADWSSSETKIHEFIAKLQKQLIGLKIKLTRSLNQLKISTILSTKDPVLIKIGQKVLNQDLQGLSCSQIYQFNLLMEAFSRPSAATIERQCQSLSDQLVKQWKQFNQAISINITGKSELVTQTKVNKSNNFEVGIKVIKKAPQTQIIPMRRMNERSRSKSTSPNYLKIEDIAKLNQTSEQFQTVLKVSNIKKKFDTGYNKRVEFEAGDETGYAICVATDSPLIKEGNVIHLTECRIYMFHGKVKQIQPNMRTLARSTNHRIDHIDFKNNISRQFAAQEPKFGRRNPSKQLQLQHSEGQQTQGKRPTKTSFSKNEKITYTKVEDIVPGDQNLNLIVEVVRIDDVEGNCIECLLGDGTGVVNAVLPSSLKFIKEGVTILINRIAAVVEKERIRMSTNKRTWIQQATIRFPKINVGNNISELQWQVQDD